MGACRYFQELLFEKKMSNDLITTSNIKVNVNVPIAHVAVLNHVIYPVDFAIGIQIQLSAFVHFNSPLPLE